MNKPRARKITPCLMCGAPDGHEKVTATLMLALKMPEWMARSGPMQLVICLRAQRIKNNGAAL